MNYQTKQRLSELKVAYEEEVTKLTKEISDLTEQALALNALKDEYEYYVSQIEMEGTR